MKYKRIERKVDRIIQLLEAIASQLPHEVAIDNAMSRERAPLAAEPPSPAPPPEPLTAQRDPLALLEDREEWRKLIEGWHEPAGFPPSSENR